MEPYYFMHPHLRGGYKEITENNLTKILERKKCLKEKTMKSCLFDTSPGEVLL